MATTVINSFSELIYHLKKGETSFCLVYKQGSESSECACNNFTEGSEKFPEKSFLMVDVTRTRDIHEKYNIGSVPVIIQFSGEKAVNFIKGCHDKDYLETLFSGKKFKTIPSISGSSGDVHITVYSTPTCTYCNSLKNYLSSKKIPFKDIDVSQDQRAAEEMVKRSGQQGVPQSIINNELVIGFDKPRIDQLLNIQ